MGICEAHQMMERNSKISKANERYTGIVNIPLQAIDKAEKSICKISYEDKYNGMGFFILLNNSFKCIMTDYHIVPKDLINNIINIQIYNNKNINVKLCDRDIKFYENLLITIIEIKESDEIIKDINFLDYDLSFYHDYEQYKYRDIFLLQYSNKNDISFSNGKIIKIYDKCAFLHNIDGFCSGSPIILLNTLKVIGINRQGEREKHINYGTFIGEIFNQNNDLSNNINKDNIKNNYIIGEIDISEEAVGEDIRIINSYEEDCRQLDNSIKDEYKNEKEIKECKIEINNTKIEFCYTYKFEKIGKYIIKYIFDKNLTKMNNMFSGCSSLIKLDLSNFNTDNATDMSFMFSSCSSLQNINLSNLNTKNVTNMSVMFFDCSSLTNLNLSSFNTKNVTDMSEMFSGCSSLTNLNLSNFNTQNVTNMNYMFSSCSSLTNLNLGNFNTKNVTKMSGMFNRCSSLTDLNLSNFNTQNVTDMDWMFSDCSSLKNLDLSKFSTKNVTNMNYMFSHCNVAIKKSSITKDSKIKKYIKKHL